MIKRAITGAGAMMVFLSSSSVAYADSFDDQINALKAEQAQQAAQANAAKAQANTYQAELNNLNAQIGALRTQISINQLKSQKLNAQIEDAQTQMAKQKGILAENIKSIYLSSNVSALEMLASSSDISDFFNQQQYQDKVKDKIQAAMATIVELKASLEKQQADLTAILNDQKNQRNVLATKQSEANQLLATAQQSAAAADQQVQQKNSEIGKLKAQQAAALAARFGNSGLTGGGACGGGYPGKWCNAAQDSVVDNWGMYNRECVSYAAFKVAVSGRTMPYWGGSGNANQWPSNARASGIAVDGNPHEGDIAISTAGPYGHAMYVEFVTGNKVHVSQYNYGNNGEYSEMTIPAAGLYLIHF